MLPPDDEAVSAVIDRKMNKDANRTEIRGDQQHLISSVYAKKILRDFNSYFNTQQLLVIYRSKGTYPWVLAKQYKMNINVDGCKWKRKNYRRAQLICFCSNFEWDWFFNRYETAPPSNATTCDDISQWPWNLRGFISFFLNFFHWSVKIPLSTFQIPFEGCIWVDPMSYTKNNLKGVSTPV